MMHDLVMRSRSCRRFDSSIDVSQDQLKQLVELARLTPSAGNKQPLKYFLVNDEATREKVFARLRWAAYLHDWPGPSEDERPAAYIIILGDTEISATFGCDHGIAAQTIMLGATEMGLGGCIIASVDRDRLRRELGIPVRFEILLVLALGKPRERVVIDHLASGDDIKYWRDAQQTHHVPKRSMESILLRMK